MKSTGNKHQKRPVTTGPTLDTVKKVKTRIREEREMKKLFEGIADRLLNNQMHEILNEMEEKCNEMIHKRISELRHDIFNVESSVSVRIANLEGKINAIKNHIDEVQTENNKKWSSFQEQIVAVSKEAKSSVETERNKRLMTIKKTHDQIEAQMENSRAILNQSKTESMNALNSLHEDFRVHSKELSSLKDKLDEILIKQYGYLPHSRGLTQQYVQYPDRTHGLDSITQRLQRLEVAVANDEELNNSFDNGRESPVRNSVGNKSAMVRVRRLEEHMLELQSQIKENEIDIQHLKTNLVHSLRNSSSPTRERDCEIKHIDDESRGRFHHTTGPAYSDLKEMDKRIKKLTENTSKACRSLSNGLSEVQHATLNLFSWTDDVHDAFDRVANKVDLPTNLCPRAKVSSRTNNSNKSSKFDFN